MRYYRPLVQAGRVRPEGALVLAGGPYWFAQAEEIARDGGGRIVAAGDVPRDWQNRLTRPRAPVAGKTMDRARIMGILNVTPDSFSDGGDFSEADAAVAQARRMVSEGADIIDVGGESTRPGARTVPEAEEIDRTAPVIAAIREAVDVGVSIDTRKRGVAKAAAAAGAELVNDISGFTFDVGLAPFCAQSGLAVCVMHSRGNPETMQDDPRYDDVLLDVYDFLAGQVAMLEELGLPRDRIVVDPGIGFGKTVAHNLTLLRGIALFHGLGCPVLLGASRKGFIGKLGHAPEAKERAPGSIAVGLAAVAQGVQILRVHDVAATAQALALWRAVEKG
ncbi:dihydropteroate synthase [Marimonas arenosa]|uniref:dihydropteroate synthase n=1 Tax=Marimonas arenosa TaxID=1795305 RepID=UPI0035E3D51E